MKKILMCFFCLYLNSSFDASHKTALFRAQDLAQDLLLGSHKIIISLKTLNWNEFDNLLEKSKSKNLVNKYDHNGLNLLSIAAVGGLERVLEKLLDKKIFVGIANKDGSQAIHWATLAANFGISRKLLSEGAEINATDKNRNTPLHFAASVGNLEGVKCLIKLSNILTAENKISINLEAKNKTDMTPLALASIKGHDKVIKELIISGADKEVQCSTFLYTPLHLAAISGRVDSVAELLQQGANIEAKNSLGTTPLGLAVEYSLDKVDLIKLFLKNNASITTQNIHGNSPMLFVALKGSISLIKEFLAKGPNLNLKNKMGVSLLHAILLNQNEAVLNEFLPNIRLSDLRESISFFEQIIKKESKIKSIEKKGLDMIKNRCALLKSRLSNLNVN